VPETGKEVKDDDDGPPRTVEDSKHLINQSKSLILKPIPKRSDALDERRR